MDFFGSFRSNGRLSGFARSNGLVIWRYAHISIDKLQSLTPHSQPINVWELRRLVDIGRNDYEPDNRPKLLNEKVTIADNQGDPLIRR